MRAPRECAASRGAPERARGLQEVQAELLQLWVVAWGLIGEPVVTPRMAVSRAVTGAQYQCVGAGDVG